MSASEKDVDYLEELLKKEVPKEKKPTNDLRSEKSLPLQSNDSIIKNVNNKVLIDILSPEISKNEQAKRIHKLALIILLTVFLIIQFFSVYGITNSVINYGTGENVDHEILKSLLTFVSAYITSVVVELIAILSYIVKNVFDASIAELVKIFKAQEK